MQIINPNAVPLLQVAGRIFTDVTNLLILQSLFNGAAAGYCSPRKQNGTAGYPVPAGKSFRVMAVQVSVLTVAANGFVALGYQDADVGFGTNTAPTNLVQVAGSGNGSAFSTNSIGILEYAHDFLVPTGKYLYTYNNGTAAVGHMRIFGYEV